MTSLTTRSLAPAVTLSTLGMGPSGPSGTLGARLLALAGSGNFDTGNGAISQRSFIS